MEAGSIKAAILDLDGVITQTATLHAEAWKKMFDQYNDKRKDDDKEPFEPFSIEKDYPEYVDGMPRYDGVNNFLKSRNIDLPWGGPDDEPGRETVCGLGNLKNEMFLRTIDSKGADVITPNVEVVREWRKAGLKTAIVSSSKNCRRILRSVGLEDLFDVRVDGMVSAERDLEGKPAPDIFLEAADELGIDPQEALVVEDALAGVKAGSRGNFKIVIGIAHGDKVEQMEEKGADIVVKNLKELNLKIESALKDSNELPDAIDQFQDLKKEWQNKEVFLFLDYDGTLSPIVEEYDKAFLSEEMREVIKNVTQVCKTAVVSGRGREDVKSRVNLDNIYYAGSHGFEISGPGGFYYELDRAKEIIPILDKIEKELKDNLSTIDGVKLERKKFALAVHYRQAAEKEEENVKRRVDQIVRNVDEIVQGRGKKVIELKPNVYWHKGKALNHLLNVLNKEKAPSYVMYIGDDITDEDAFMQIREGTGILVGDHGEKTYARFHLQDTDQVKEFLMKLTEELK